MLTRGRKALLRKDTYMAYFSDTNPMSPLPIGLVGLGDTNLRAGKPKLMLEPLEMGGRRMDGAVEDTELRG